MEKRDESQKMELRDWRAWALLGILLIAVVAYYLYIGGRSPFHLFLSFAGLCLCTLMAYANIKGVI